MNDKDIQNSELTSIMGVLNIAIIVALVFTSLSFVSPEEAWGFLKSNAEGIFVIVAIIALAAVVIFTTLKDTKAQHEALTKEPVETKPVADEIRF